MKKTLVLLILLILIISSSCSSSKKESIKTDLDLSQYSSIILDIKSVEKDFFTGVLPWAYPCTYIVHYSLDKKFSVGDRVEVYYTELKSPDEGKKTEWTADVIAVFVDFSEFELEPGVCYKPVIYMYPTNSTEVSIKLDYNGKLTHTYPLYEDGWRVTAYPDGTLVDDDGLEYPYLFWEGESNVEYDMSQGFCVSGVETEIFLRDKLSYIGLNEKEMEQFLEFWLPHMRKNDYNLISFQTTTYTENVKLTIIPKPDSILRVFMTFTPLNEPKQVKEQVIYPFERKGFTVVEWGGEIIKK